MTVLFIIAVYLVVINIAGFAAMGDDKKRARDHRSRTPEKVLFGLALAGGALGTTLGMWVFRHKTKHWYFVVGMPAIAVLWAGIVSILVFLGLIS